MYKFNFKKVLILMATYPVYLVLAALTWLFEYCQKLQKPAKGPQIEELVTSMTLLAANASDLWRRDVDGGGLLHLHLCQGRPEVLPTGHLVH